MSDLIAALALALLLEGLALFLAPRLVRRALEDIHRLSAPALRLSGLLACLAGLGIMWAARS